MTRGAHRLGRAVATLLAGSAVALLAAGCSGGSDQAADQDSYGGLPTFLPTLSTQQHRLVDASVRHPALASQGDQVRVSLREGTVLATVTGPETPGQGLVPEPGDTYATWTVRLTGASATIPLAYRQFVTVDQTGRVYHPRAVQAAQPLPASLRPGQDLTFQVRALMATGEGVMRWSPDGGLAPVQWDFEVEVD